MQIEVWINSFIPQNIVGYSRALPGASGQTMIPGPLPISDCFHTDQRGFSDRFGASSRMRSMASISLIDFVLLGTSHECDATVECDCEDGDVECRKAASSADLKIDNFTTGDARCTFSFLGGAGNPCATGSPQINWSVKTEIKRIGAGKVQISALAGSVVEPFPAFEMYAKLNGKTANIFKRSPDPGTTPWSLFGDPKSPVSGTAIL